MVHPRLAQLEQNQMLEVEGGAPDWCMRILRHETGHALDNAYRFRRRRGRQRLFGNSSQRYPEYYTPRPYSKSFVMHLELWYAQSHPDEDFAETFAVWLTNDVDWWKKRYAGWPALKKLEFVDALMREIAGQVPPRLPRRRYEPLGQLRKTFRQHYQEKQGRYGVDFPNFYDRDLRRVFSDSPQHAANPAAHSFLKKIRKEVRRYVSRWTGVYQYTIDQVFEEMLNRTRELNLRLAASEEQAKLDFMVVLTVQTMNFLHSGGHQLAL
jgi:hypothetical protein